MERPGHRVVFTGLVEEPSTGAVDDDAAWPGALQSHAATAGVPAQSVAGDLHDRHPPGFAHVRQVGAVRHRHPQAVAGVVRWGHRTAHRPAQIGVDEPGVPFEAARAQDDPASGPDPDVLAVLLDPHTGDALGRAEQFDRAGLGRRGDAAVQQSLEQSGDQRGPGHAVVTVEVVGGGVDAGAGLGIDSDVAEVHREGGDAVGPFAELGQVERGGRQGPSTAGPSAGQLGLVIGETLGDLEPQIAVLLPGSPASPGRYARTSRRVRGPWPPGTAPPGRPAHPRRDSSVPASRLCAGIQVMPPDTAVVPPTVAAFSKIATRAPLVAAVSAADSPAPPLPSTTTSYFLVPGDFSNREF